MATESVNVASVSELIENNNTPIQIPSKKQMTNIERKRQQPNESNDDFIKRINKSHSLLNKKKITSLNIKKIINPVVITTPVTLSTEPVSVASVSEIIEENKTPTQKIRKQRMSRIQSREQRPGETNFDFGQRIKFLDAGITRRALVKTHKTELSNMQVADMQERLKKLIQRQRSDSVDTNITDATTKI